MPASERIYQPFDFRTVYEQDRKFYRKGDEAVPGISITDAAAADCRGLAEAANRELSGSCQVFAVRDEAYYMRLIREYDSDGGKLKVYRRDDEIVDCRGYYPGEEEDGIPKIMVRIVDVRRMLMSLSLHSLAGACFCVTDPLIEENNRCIVITGTEYSGVMLMDGKEENSEGTISIAALASLVFGAKTVEEVCLEEGVLMTDRLREELGKIISLSKICLNETV